MKRVWKPIDINGLRLYRVKQMFPGHPDWDKILIVAAKSPTNARQLVEAAYAATEWIVEPVYASGALNVYQPASWTE